MNSTSRMVLIPEDQYKNNVKKRQIDFDPIMSSDLPTSIKMKLINQMMMKDDIKKEKVKEKDENRLRNELTARYRMYQDLKKGDEGENNGDDYVKSDEDSEDSFHTVLDNTYNKEVNETPTISQRVFNRRESSTPQTSRVVDNDLLSILKKESDLVDDDNKIFNDEGKIKGSDIERVVEYLKTKNYIGRAPNGTTEVLKYIKENCRECLNLIINPKAKDKLKQLNISWLKASNITKENITHRKR